MLLGGFIKEIDSSTRKLNCESIKLSIEALLEKSRKVNVTVR